MYSSKIKEIWEKIHSIKSDNNIINNTNQNPNKELLSIPNYEKNKYIFPFSDYFTIKDLFTNRFKETSKIFSKLSQKDFFCFIYLSNISIYNSGSEIFSKEEICNTYNFILKGDIELYSDNIEENIELKNNYIIDNIYGHLIKDKYNYNAKAKNEVIIIHILKTNFDILIKSINENIKKFKSNFIQKFFPKIRTFTGDILIKILTYFERVKYKKYEIIINSNCFNNYIYLIISGEIGLCLDYKDINNNYLILEKLYKGDIFGINTALEGIKNEYKCIVLTEETELYKISKEDLFYYFNYCNELILDIKSIGDLQEMSISNKINYLKNNINNKDIINKFIINIKNNNKGNNYEIVYEDPIDNILYQKWRNVKLGLDEMKNKLLGQKKKRIDENKKNNSDNNIIYNNIYKNKNANILSMYKVPNGRLNLKLNNNQIKSLNKMNGICGIKNNNNKEGNNDIKINEDEEKGKK